MNKMIGTSPPRTEDHAFLTGQGCYLDDLVIPGACHAFILRSPHPHALINTIDTSAAQTAAGVVAILDGVDLKNDNVPPLPCLTRLPLKPGTTQVFPERMCLAQDRVRYEGEPVAMVLAETREMAEAAAGLIQVDYTRLPANADPGRALSAQQIHGDVPENLNFNWVSGDHAATEAQFAQAARIVTLDLVNQRVAPTPLETRGSIGQWSETDGYTLHVSCQGPHWIKSTLCEHVLTDVPEDKVRVITPDVGGGFGTKLFLTPEYVLVLWAARRCGRPVRWIATRTEGFLSDTDGRDNVTTARIALDADHRFLALDVSIIANMGAWLSEFAPTIPTGDRMHEGSYVFKAAHVELRGVFTNTGPVESYRGAGRPEATYMIERLVDKAGRETGLGPIEIRRRNFVRADQIPYQTQLGHVFDSGDFPQVFERALVRADHANSAARAAQARSRGMLHGLGLSSYIGFCGGDPEITAQLSVAQDGYITARLGCMSSGQGHKTAFAQIVADALDAPFDTITVAQGDTAKQKYGTVTAGSRSIPLGGVACVQACEALIERGKPIAAQLLNCKLESVIYANTRFRVKDVDRSVSLADVATAAEKNGNRYMADGVFTSSLGTFTNGCHVCEVEIDPDTGATEIIRYVAVDDFGNIINPALVEGQVHGGVAQGLGQALLEQVVFNPDATLASTSLENYALPTARAAPFFQSETMVFPCVTNPLGVKGMGEAGAIAAPPAVINAIFDALYPLGVRQLDMPATSQTVWQALEAARNS